jgi:CRP/FNR family transcriptional regulator, cyclic AMP receptor protein
MAARAEFLAMLGDGDREELERIGRPTTAERGDVIMARGESGDRVVVLVSGRVKIVAPNVAGRETVLAFRGAGALLGEQALVDDRPRSANVVAVEAVELLAVAASSFRAYLNARPKVVVAMLVVLSSKLRESDGRLSEFAAADALGRVCSRLVELCETEPGAEPGTAVQISLPITQEELAGWTGASLESTAKALKALRELGWIATGRRSIEVLDLDAVRRRSP